MDRFRGNHRLKTHSQAGTVNGITRIRKGMMVAATEMLPFFPFASTRSKGSPGATAEISNNASHEERDIEQLNDSRGN